jgi:DNA topoisomerase IA
VVESPTKVKTIKKYLGKEFNVVATVGHIKDLPPKEIGIDIEKNFKPKYRTIPGKQKVITNLKREAGNAADIYLAPDPDREGEAIAWHTAELLKKKRAPLSPGAFPRAHQKRHCARHKPSRGVEPGQVRGAAGTPYPRPPGGLPSLAAFMA